MVMYEENLNPIQVTSCTISELFLGKILAESGETISGSLEIPEYQRPYVWGKKEILKLISDLNEYFSNNSEKPLYYMGSVILHQANGKLYIIDGQQRLTTLALIQHIKDKNQVPKLKYVSPITVENIKRNHNILLEEIRGLNIDFPKINITLIVTENEDEAYTFFETQNTGGVRLSGIDIIKAHHLRVVSSKGKRQEKYAITWEQQKNISTVIEQLIKARRWNVLNWRDVPSDRDEKGTKTSIIEDFSEQTVNSHQKTGYKQIVAKENYTSFKIPKCLLSIRQPLSNGENFIDYLEQFCELYQRLFTNESDTEIPDEYYRFNKEVIKYIDGTAFLKEFYEIAMLCYVDKFDIENILEACYWIFRYAYSIRVSNPKTVKENSISAFLKRGNYLFDIILSSFNHESLILELKNFNYAFNNENSIGNTVKARFINRIRKYFGIDIDIDVNNYDDNLKQAIKSKINGK
jgi:hypothetical protein